MKVWLAYLDYTRRRTEFEKEETESMQELRIVFNRACEHLERSVEFLYLLFIFISIYFTRETNIFLVKNLIEMLYKPRPKYIFNKCGTNIYFFVPSPSPNFKLWIVEISYIGLGDFNSEFYLLFPSTENTIFIPKIIFLISI